MIFEVFASCTTDFDPENRSWCSTKGMQDMDWYPLISLNLDPIPVDSRGVHISGQGEYGYCPSSCQTNILTTPPPPAQAWTAWSQCSASCGGGTRVRTNTNCPPSRWVDNLAIQNTQNRGPSLFFYYCNTNSLNEL